MAVLPEVAAPIANPAIPYSDRGVLNTLSVPYFSLSPMVHLNTPPNLTSSPKMIAESSFSIAVSKAFVMVAHKFIFFKLVGSFNPRSATFNLSEKSKASMSF